MRRVAVVAVLMIPAVAWTALRLWVGANMDLWEASGQLLPLHTRVLIGVDSWAIRMAPLAVILVVFSSPAWITGIAWATGSLRLPGAAEARRTLLVWWATSMVASVAALGSFVPRSLPFIGLYLAFAWLAFLAHSVSVGAACALQRQRVAAGRSSFGVWRILWVTWVCLLLVPPVPVVPIAVWALWRRDQRFQMPRAVSA